MYDLYLTYSEMRSGGAQIDPNDRWSDREPTYIDFRPCALYFERPNETFAHGLSNDEIKTEVIIPGEDVYLVVVRYQTGDTFGYSTGNWEIIGVYSDYDKVKEVEREINEDSYEGPPYPYWRGYFERLESVEVHKMFVR